QPAPARPEPKKEAPAAPVPSALRAKGLDDRTEERLTFSGPDEDGGTAVRRSGVATAPNSSGGDAAAQGTRRERREAARAQSKTSKPARSKKKR
ncbi:MAG: hypothetical protein ABW188_01330, partial [Rhodococcus fascians]